MRPWRSVSLLGGGPSAVAAGVEVHIFSRAWVEELDDMRVAGSAPMARALCELLTTFDEGLGYELGYGLPGFISQSGDGDIVISFAKLEQFIVPGSTRLFQRQPRAANGAEDEIMMVGDDPDNELEDLSVTSSMKLMSVRFALPRILDVSSTAAHATTSPGSTRTRTSRRS